MRSVTSVATVRAPGQRRQPASTDHAGGEWPKLRLDDPIPEFEQSGDIHLCGRMGVHPTIHRRRHDNRH